VRTEVACADVIAERDGERLVAEAKGMTTAPGLDLDTLYGQLLRRMTSDPSTRRAVVVPKELVKAAARVPQAVRDTLRVDIYGVTMDYEVRKH
jgi:hypothetical protein